MQVLAIALVAASSVAQVFAADVGGMCGGIAAIQCDQWLMCKMSSNKPDASGVCQWIPTGKEGAKCGGIAGIKCNTGLKCKVPTTIPDAYGTCVKK
ncbi:hypothetical protein DYB32_003492 [Aphanomyces invadans]|uniref:CBM1 domain-containing protein n=1 Tax=Aphanomyces invadans TaxID=157072 RepID=A0A3R6Z698_9STRA|nr:hypothetical protein DYB32_003492 [Aphanomyces invadans]